MEWKTCNEKENKDHRRKGGNADVKMVSNPQGSLCWVKSMINSQKSKTGVGGVHLRNDGEWGITYNRQLVLPLFGLLFLQWQWVSLLYSQSLYNLIPHTHSHTRLYPREHTMSQRKKYWAIWLVASNIINRAKIICLTFTHSKC